MEIPVACFKDVALPPQLQSVDISIFLNHMDLENALSLTNQQPHKLWIF